jgi:amino acid transporter
MYKYGVNFDGVSMGQKIFTRDSTGLVRDVSVWDSFFMNNWSAGGVAASLWFLSVYPVWFPQANLVLSVFIAMGAALLVGTLYSLIVVIMPRAGTDYVFVSRALKPSIGTGFSLNLIFWILLGGGAFGLFATFSFIAQGTFALGAMTGTTTSLSGWSSFSSSQTGTVIIGLAIYAVIALLVILGLKYYVRYFQRPATYFCVAMVLILVVLGLVFTNQDFISTFNSYMSPLSGTPDPYHDIISTATANGYTPPSGFSWNQTLSVAALWYFIPLFPMVSAWMGGEIQSAKRIKSQFLAMSGGQIFTMLMLAALITIWQRDFGANWLTALGYLAINSPSHLPSWITGAAPYWQAGWTIMLTHNPILGFLVSLGWIAQAILIVPPVIVAASRHVFAWSFDRIVPSKFSEVSGRFRSPMYAMSIISIIAIGGFLAAVFTTYLAIVSGAVLGQMVSYMVAAIAGIVFVKRRKSIFNSSPVSSLKIGSTPILPILAVGSLIVLLWFGSYYLTTLSSLAISGLGPTTLEICLGLFLIGIGGYYVARYVRKREGIPLDMAFSEIPPE